MNEAKESNGREQKLEYAYRLVIGEHFPTFRLELRNFK